MGLPGRGVHAALVFEICHTRCNQVEYLTDVKHNTYSRSPYHEVCENGFLGGSRNVAVHQIRTGAYVTLDFPGQLETVIDVVKHVEKQDLEGCFDKQAHQISPPETTVFLAGVFIQAGLLTMLCLVFALPLLPVGYV